MNWLEDSVKKRKVSHSKWSVEKEMNDEFNRLSPMVTRLLHDMGEAEWGKTSPGHYLTNTSSCWILACAERVDQG